MNLQLKQVPVKGIDRSAPDNICEDGLCDELINLRYKDGAWRPVGLKEVSTAFAWDTNDIIYWHPNASRFVYYDNSAGTVRHTVPPLTSGLLKDISGETFVGFSHFESYLVVTTTKDRYAFYWDNSLTTPAYVELEDVPELTVEFLDNLTFDDKSATGTDYETTLVKYLEKRSELEDKGYYEGHVLIRYAFRLYDGSYIKHSAPHYLCLGVSPSGNTDMQYTAAYQFDPFRAGNIKADFTEETKLGGWRNIITGVDVFVTRPISAYNLDTYEPAGWTFPRDIPTTTREEILSDSIFYKVASFTIDDYHDGTKIIHLPAQGEWTSLEILPVDDYTHHKISGYKSLIYNKRIHYSKVIIFPTELINPFIGGTTDFRDKFTDYSGSSYTYSGTTSTHQTRLVAKLKTDQGIKTVVSPDLTVPVWELAANPDGVLMRPFIFYPDSRCISLRVVVKDTSTDNWKIFLTWNMTPHPYLNYSYYNYGVNTQSVFDARKTGLPTYADATGDPFTMVESDTIVESNRIQASEAQNPIIFRAENSYRVSTPDATIKGIAVTLDAMSEGQFGRFPLYVFTDRGIWTMEQGTGDVLYANIVPISNHIVSNDKSITSLQGAVLFVTTEGMFSVSGRQVQALPLKADGSPSTYLRGVELQTKYYDISNNSQVVQVNDMLDNASILDKLQTGIFAYDHKENEIIVAQSWGSDWYCYAYNFNGGHWYKRTEPFDAFVDKYTGWFGIVSSGGVGYLFDLSSEKFKSASYDSMDCFFQSRPIKLSGQGYKRLHESFLRCSLIVDNHDHGSTTIRTKFCSLFIFGSQDGKSWKFMNGRKIKATTLDQAIQDIKLPKVTTSCRYFIVVFGCKLQEKSTLSRFDVSYVDRFARKLR